LEAANLSDHREAMLVTESPAQVLHLIDRIFSQSQRRAA
jgi:hypothetical protein